MHCGGAYGPGATAHSCRTGARRICRRTFPAGTHPCRTVTLPPIPVECPQVSCSMTTGSVPERAGLIVGDIIHNLRSALACLSYGIAANESPTALNRPQEKATAFPIVETPKGLANFMDATVGAACTAPTPRPHSASFRPSGSLRC